MDYKAITLRQILNQTGPRPKARSRNSRIMGIRPSAVKDIKRFSFLVKSKEVYSWPQGHIASIHYPSLSLKKFQNNRKITPMNQTVYLNCTCPAFQYWGSAYWSNQYAYNFPGRHENRAPDIRDPLGENWTCKHGIRVMNYVSKKGFESLYKRFTKKAAGLRMASREDLFPVISEFMIRKGYSQEDVDDVLFGFHEASDVDFDERLIQVGVYLKV